MNYIKISNYEVEDGFYAKNGERMTNFLILCVKKIIVENSNSIAFSFVVYIKGREYPLIIPFNKIRRTRFLQEVPVKFKDEEEFYVQFRNELLEMDFEKDDILYQTNRNGLQQINGKWVFVYTNGSIGVDGFDSKIYSGISGFYIPPEAIVDPNKTKETVKNLFQEYNINPEVFYPLFFLNIMAITNGYFRSIGEQGFMKLTFWLDGNSGAGKTELAKTVGTYIFEDKDLNSNLVSVTGKRSYVLKRLCDSSGTVFILDDVKNEKVRERNNSVNIIVDDCVRSVNQGKMTDTSNKQSVPELIDTCTLITGEYMDTQESQNARLIYLKVDGFLKDKKNSDTLRRLQKNPMWLTTVCAGYVQWLLRQMQDDNFSKSLIDKLDKMRHNQKNYDGIDNAERLNENRYMLEMACFMAEKYFENIRLTGEYIEKYHEYAMKSIEKACNNTYALLGGEKMILYKAMKNVLKTCKIRKARYQSNIPCKDRVCKYRQDYFMLYDDDDVLYIEDYDESLLKSTHDLHEQCDGRPCVIIREEKLINLLHEEIQRIQKESPIPSIVVENILVHLSVKLRKMQFIYKQRRLENDLGRTATKYPVCFTTDQPAGFDNLYEEEINNKVCIIDFKPVIQMNTGHPCMEILMERLEDGILEKTLPDINMICDTEGKKMDEVKVYRVRKAFMNSKFLYKE